MFYFPNYFPNFSIYFLIYFFILECFFLIALNWCISTISIYKHSDFLSFQAGSLAQRSRKSRGKIIAENTNLLPKFCRIPSGYGGIVPRGSQRPQNRCWKLLYQRNWEPGKVVSLLGFSHVLVLFFAIRMQRFWLFPLTSADRQGICFPSTVLCPAASAGNGW